MRSEREEIMTRRIFSGIWQAVLLQTLVLLPFVPARAQQRDIWVVAESPGYDKAHSGVLADMNTRGITPVRAEDLTTLRDNVLAELASGDCIRNLYIVGHGSPGELSLYGMSSDTDRVIGGTGSGGYDALFELMVVRGCPGPRTLYLFGCNVGALCQGSDKLFEFAKNLGVTVRAPIDMVSGKAHFAYLQTGRWQEATNSMTSPPICIDSLDESTLIKRNRLIEQLWNCPCNDMVYMSQQLCESGCPSGLGCFTLRCEPAYRNNSWDKYEWEPILHAFTSTTTTPSGRSSPQKSGAGVRGHSSSRGSAELSISKANAPWSPAARGRASGDAPISKVKASWSPVGFSEPCVIKETDNYRMWYAGWDSTDVMRIGFATSSYGFDWKDHAASPVLEEGPAGSWDDGEVYNPTVLKDGAIYKMWYTGWSPQTRVPRIGYATSPDGITWTKHPGPVLDLGASETWDCLGVGAPTVSKDGGLYEMWYEGEDADAWWRIGYATSPDGINWVKDSHNPVLSEGASGSWEEWGLGGPTVIKVGSRYHMWYHATDSYDGVRIGYAVSQNGYVWTKSPENPVIDRGSGGSWDNSGIGHPTVVRNSNEDTYEMWYRGADTDENYAIGFATSVPGDALLGIESPPPSELTPDSYKLFQNYPNPFNSTTTIRYELPKPSPVKLNIYDILGREVSVLVNENKSAGSYEVKLDAAGLSSGVYFYRLQAGNFVQTRKLLLVR